MTKNREEFDWRDIRPFWPSQKAKKWLTSRTDAEWASMFQESQKVIFDAVHKLARELREFVEGGLCLGRTVLLFRSYKDSPTRTENCWVFRESLRVEEWLRQLDASYQMVMVDGTRRGLRWGRVITENYRVKLEDMQIEARSFTIDDKNYATELLHAMNEAPLLMDTEILERLSSPHPQSAEMWDNFAKELN
jgi:hypothetical protein